jgi:hypothetical protein
MKKLAVAIFVAALVVFPVNFAFADGDTKIGIENTNTLTATGGNAWQQQGQEQQQKQQQQQESTNTAVVERNHIVAPLPHAFVNPIAGGSKEWRPFICDPLNKVFTKERIDNMRNAGSFWDKGGSLFDALVLKDVRAVIHEKFTGKPDDRPIIRLDWIPQGTNDRLLAEINCEGQYGWPLGATLGSCLFEAKKKTNTTRVFVQVREKKDGKVTGASIGSGAVAAKILGDNEDRAASVSAGGLLGSTYARDAQYLEINLWAFNDGPIDLPEGTKDPCAAPPKEEPKVAPPPPPKAKCDVSNILLEIEMLIEGTKHCLKDCLNNMLLWKRIGDGNTVAYKCTGDKKFLTQAEYAYNRADKNFQKGKEPDGTKTRTLRKAQSLSKDIYWNQAAVIRELYGRDAEIAFAQPKGMTMMPSGIDETRR